MSIRDMRLPVVAIIAIIATLIGTYTQRWWPYALWTSIAVAAVIAALFLIAPGGLSVTDRIARRHRARHPIREQAQLYSISDVATVWDGAAAHQFVALSPAPFQLAVVDVADPTLTPPSLPIDAIRPLLIQDDIHVAEINILQTAYRRYGLGDYNDAYARLVGNTTIPTTINTIIDVSIDLGKSLPSVQARAFDGSDPNALGRTVHIAAARVDRKLNIDGYTARLLTRQEVVGYHMSALRFLNDGIRNEQWTHLGGKDARQTVVARPADWSPRSPEFWYQVPADRMAASFAITTGRYRAAINRISATLSYTYLGAAKLPGKQLHLERVVGEQGNLATRLLPLAKTVPALPHRSDLTLGGNDEFPVDLPATGLGVYLGESTQEGRVFCNLQTGGDILYVHAPLEFIANLATRASAVGATVGLHLDTNIDMWAAVTKANPQLMTVNPRRPSSVEIRRYEPGLTRPGPTTAVIAWCPKGIPSTAGYSITMRTDNTAAIVTPEGDAEFLWDPSADERRYLPTRVAEPAPI